MEQTYKNMAMLSTYEISKQTHRFLFCNLEVAQLNRCRSTRKKKRQALCSYSSLIVLQYQNSLSCLCRVLNVGLLAGFSCQVSFMMLYSLSGQPVGQGILYPLLVFSTASWPVGQGRVRETPVGYDLIQYNAKCPHIRLNGENTSMPNCFRS